MNEKINQIWAQIWAELKKQITENWRLLLVATIATVISWNSFQNDKTPKTNNRPISPAQTEKNNPKNIENTVNSNDSIKNQEKIPKNNPTDLKYEENTIAQTAQKGEGLTHMARRALKGYLERNNKTLTSEQKIYAEDYIRKNTPVQKIIIGQNISFKEETIILSVEKSEKLSEKQIKNLKKFVPLAKNL